MRWASAFVAVMVGAVALAATPARANDGGALLAGGVAGFVGGMIAGNAMHPHHPPPRYVYVEDDPPPVECHWERGRAFWDDYEGVWRRQRVRVCD
jgi:hypothetical protein